MLFVGMKMSSSIGVFTLMILLLFQIYSVSCLSNNHDTSVLQALKNAWNNSPKNWIGSDPCEANWIGIDCINGRVTKIVLPNLNMEGILLDSITTLSELQKLDLTSNPNLTGPLPTKIGDLKKLINLHLMGCGFNGQIPHSIGGLEQLERLSLNSNKFTGTIPASIGRLSHLNWLDITDNLIEGEIPVSVGSSLPGLDMLILAQHFHFGKNKLSGRIPAKLFNPSMLRLRHVLFEGNQFTSQIPTSISLVKSLQVIRLDRNRLTGVIPSSLNNLTNLVELYLADNIFTGRLPNLSNMRSLCTLDVSNNRLTSSVIPSWISSLQNLRTLRMEGINLEGEIPISLFSPLLETVILKRNWLNQTLDFTTLNNKPLELVDLQYNKVIAYKPTTNKNMNISLAYNPVCPEVGDRQSFCDVFPRNSSFTTAQENCSSHCDHGKEPNGECHCMYPVKGTLTFRSPSFSGYSEPTNFENLMTNLVSAFKNGTTYIKGSVAIRNIREDEIEHHLLIDVMIFPLKNDRFDQAGMGSVISRFSTQNFQPAANFGPYVFKPEKYEPHSGPKSSNKGIIIGAVVGSSFLLLLLTIAGIYALRQKERAKKATEQINPFAKWDKSKSSVDAPQLMVAKAFTFEEMRRYANNFAMENDVGGGGYGQVYKGTLPSGQLVAIKRAQPDSLQGALEFKTEIELLSRVHHKNVVRLLGFCFDRGEQMLVYEYIPNGSLRDSLSGKNGIRLDWTSRLRIALGSGKGLAYLHELADPPIIHRDIKSSNILLDESLTSKVADFGLSKLVDEAQKTQMTTQVKGTMGYLDPEYYMTNQLTEKSDVYGFGVVMLELLTSKIPIENGKHVVTEVKMKMNKSKKLYDLQELLDIKMNTSDQSLEGFEMYVDLALSCVDPEGVKRPSMSEVVKEIENIMQQAGLDLNVDSSSSSRTYDEAGKGSEDPYGNNSFDYSASFPTSKLEPQ